MTAIESESEISSVKVIYEDEPAYALYEYENMGRRWQKIIVVRNDELAAWLWDMGPKEQFFTDQRFIPGGTLDRDAAGNVTKITIGLTVGDLRELAEIYRSTPPAKTQEEPSNLWEGFRTVNEDAPGGLVHRSTFGYGGGRIR